MNEEHKPHSFELLETLDAFSRLMDAQFIIPGTKIRFGLDSLLGLIPGIGDTVTLASTAYIIGQARMLGVPKFILLKMAGNAFIDWLIGLIPLLGDIFDVGYKSNIKNVALLKEHLERSRGIRS